MRKLAGRSVFLTTTTKEIEVNGRLIEFTVAANTAGVATLAHVPVGVVFTLKGTNVNATEASATITTKAGKTIILASGQIVTLMSVENDGFVIMDAVGVEGVAASATGTVIS